MSDLFDATPWNIGEAMEATAFGYSLPNPKGDSWKLTGMGTNPFRFDAEKQKQIIRSAMGPFGNVLSDKQMAKAGEMLAAPGNALEKAVESVTDFNGWFQRISIGVLALIFIAAALFMFKGSDMISTVKGIAR